MWAGGNDVTTQTNTKVHCGTHQLFKVKAFSMMINQKELFQNQFYDKGDLRTFLIERNWKLIM